MKNPRSANKIDHHIATRLRAARLESGLSQEDVSARIGVSFQQIQKYENGTNRISASRLFEMTQLYGKPLDWFFTGAPEANGKKKPIEDIGAKLIASAHGIDIAHHYLAIPGHASRQLVVDIAKALSRQ
jgi:transcriptional regulator with XRE-family HTH domain